MTRIRRYSVCTAEPIMLHGPVSLNRFYTYGQLSIKYDVTSLCDRKRTAHCTVKGRGRRGTNALVARVIEPIVCLLFVRLSLTCNWVGSRSTTLGALQLRWWLAATKLPSQPFLSSENIADWERSEAAEGIVLTILLDDWEGWAFTPEEALGPATLGSGHSASSASDYIPSSYSFICAELSVIISSDNTQYALAYWWNTFPKQGILKITIFVNFYSPCWPFSARGFPWYSFVCQYLLRIQLPVIPHCWNLAQWNPVE